MDIDEINSHDQIIIFAANWLANYMKDDFSQLNNMLKKINIPITIIGLGSHTPYEKVDAKEFINTLNPTLIDFIHLVAEHSNSISVRGYTTKELLNAMGIYNIDVTGCPSWFVNWKNDKKIIKTDLNSKSGILFHSDPEQRDLYKIMFEHFEGYTNSRLLIQSEFDLIKYLLPNFHDNYENNYQLKDKWLSNKNFGCFFQNVSEWEKFIVENIDLSFGLRIHGTIIALKNGIPAILVTHDGRTREMAEFFSIPNITVQDLTDENFSLHKIYEKADYSIMENNYSELLKNYIKFLDKNNIKHIN